MIFYYVISSTVFHTKIHPQIPALTDKFSDGSTVRLFESGSIMQYLVDKYDTDHKVSYPFGSKEYYETNNWVSLSSPERALDNNADRFKQLHWQMGGRKNQPNLFRF